MARRPVRGVTLVEVVVLTGILGLVLALLMPAVVSRGPPHHQSECMNNQNQLSKALLQYEMAHQHFPGRVNHHGDQWEGDRLVQAQAQDLNWVVVCLPYLGREDLWKEWRDGRRVQVPLGQLICPDDSPSDPLATSYVVNCGQPGPDPSPGAAYGLFHDHTVPPPQRVMVSASNIADGAQSTLMLGENIQAGLWCDTEEADVGFVWVSKPGACSRINACLDAGDQPHDIAYARPASRHGGGVVVSFCDGHQRFVPEDIDYTVYQHLMTPDSAAAGVPGELKEEDY